MSQKTGLFLSWGELARCVGFVIVIVLATYLVLAAVGVIGWLAWKVIT